MIGGCTKSREPAPGDRPGRTNARIPFECDAGKCFQDHPRQPGDGEWECSEGTGVTVCRGGLSAAGVSAAPLERGWSCGPWRVPDAGAYPTICVDFEPDVPPRPAKEGERWTCRYLYVAGLPRRECVSSPATRAGDPCAAGACPRGTSCVEGRCAPRGTAVGCFFDEDCGKGADCIFGSCVPS